MLCVDMVCCLILLNFIDVNLDNHFVSEHSYGLLCLMRINDCEEDFKHLAQINISSGSGTSISAN